MRQSKKSKFGRLFSILTMLILVCAIGIGVPMNSYAQAVSGEQKPETLMLYNKQPSDNTPYDVKNMFPGDVETKNYCLRVSYTDVLVVKFRITVETGYEKLAEVLKCKVSIEGEEVYDGLMNAVPELPLTVGEETDGVADLDYQITVYLETSVGNDYMNKELVADFIWWAEGEYNEDKDDDDDDDEDEIIPDEDVPLGDMPNTGDSFEFIIWAGLLIVSVVSILLVFVMRRRRDKNEK